MVEQSIVVPGRRYKFEGTLSEAILSQKRTKRKTEAYYCFLFNDLFVVAKRKGIISHIKKITAKRLRYFVTATPAFRRGESYTCNEQTSYPTYQTREQGGDVE